MAMNNFSYPYMPTIPGQFNPSAYMQNIGIQQPTQIPQFNAQMVSQQPVNCLTRVTGIDGAKAYQMPPNSVAALFDDSYDIMYVKSTDGAGFPTIRVFDFYEHKEETPVQQQPVNVENFATKQELETLENEIKQVKEMLSNGKQSVPEQHAEQQPRTNARSK